MPPEQNPPVMNEPVESSSLPVKKPLLPTLLAVLGVVFVLAIGAFAYLYWYMPSKTADTIAPLPPEPAAEMKKIGIIQNVQILDLVVDGFKQGMEDLGYTEGVDVEYSYQNAAGDVEAAKRIAREYAAGDVDLILAITSTIAPAAWQALQDIGADIPIVFTNGTSFTYDGFIESYRSTGKNMAGVIPDDIDVTMKKLEFMQKIQPDAKRFGIFYSNIGPGAKVVEEVTKRTQSLGLELVTYKVEGTPPESPAKVQAIADTIQEGDIDAIITVPDSVINFKENPLTLVKLSKRINAPMYALNLPIVEQGALLAYNEDHVTTGKQAAGIAHKIFTGTPAISIPIEFPSKNLLAINLKTAKEFGLTIPDALLSIADQIIPVGEATLE